MSEPEFKERRKFPRFPIAIALIYCILDSSKSNKAQTQDISVCGIGLITNEELLPNTPLDIYLNMPDNGEKIHVKGEVVWPSRKVLDNYRLGIRLKDSTLKPIPIVLRIIQTKL